MKTNFIRFAAILLLISCASKKQITRNNDIFAVTEISTDKTYGLSPKNAVMVGGANESKGPSNERKYLNLLTGPNGESIYYYRSGSCCPVKSKNGFMGMAMLDNYRVTWQGSKDTVSIYINMYDSGELKAPIGFGIKDGKRQILEMR